MDIYWVHNKEMRQSERACVRLSARRFLAAWLVAWLCGIGCLTICVGHIQAAPLAAGVATAHGSLHTAGSEPRTSVSRMRSAFSYGNVALIALRNDPIARSAFHSMSDFGFRGATDGTLPPVAEACASPAQARCPPLMSGKAHSSHREPQSLPT